MDALILTGVTAIRAIRSARRAYSALPWRLLSRSEQDALMRDAVPNAAAIDFERLERLGAWEGAETERLHVLVGGSSSRRRNKVLDCRVIARRLPGNLLYCIEPGVYCCSPAFAALEYSRKHSMQEMLVLLQELLGTYSLPPEATLSIDWGGVWSSDDGESEGDTAYYGCEAATTMGSLRAVSKWAKSSRYDAYQLALKYCAPGSASPAESMLYGMMALPKRYGAFGLSGLPGGGMLLNHRIDFSAQAIRMSSGIPYAICDIYIPSAKIDLEYNGGYHEQRAARLHDGNRNNGLRGMGIKTIVINKEQIQDVEALEAIARSIFREAGKRFQYRHKGYRTRQFSLLNALRKATGLPGV